MLKPSLLLHDWMPDNTVADIDEVLRKTGWLVCEAWGSLLGKVGYRTTEAFSWWRIEEGRVSYTGSCLDSLLKKVGLPCLGSLLLCTMDIPVPSAGSFCGSSLWMPGWLVLESIPVAY